MRVSNGFSTREARGFQEFLFFFSLFFSATEGRRESENGGSGRGMEVQWKCGYLGVQKSLKKKKKKKEGVNEGSIDKVYEETRCFSPCP